MKRLAAAAAAAIAFTLSGCGTVIETNTDLLADKQSKQAQAENFSAAEACTPEVTEPEPERDMTIAKPEIRLIDPWTLDLVSSAENAERISVYSYEVSSQSGGVVTKALIFKGDASDIAAGEIHFDTENILEMQHYNKDNSAIKTDYSAKGIRVCLSNDADEQWSELAGLEVSFETGVCNQYSCNFKGATACGAANGTLLLQTVMPVWNGELTARMNAIRDYSALGFDYSTMADTDYRMTGDMICNSVNSYLSDSGIGGYETADIGADERPTAELIIEALGTGRPAAVMVSYKNDICTDFQGFAHWITVNAYRIDESGVIWFRYVNTLTGGQGWIDSQTADAAVRVFTEGDCPLPPIILPDGSEKEITRYIDVLSEPVVDSLV